MINIAKVISKPEIEEKEHETTYYTVVEFDDGSTGRALCINYVPNVGDNVVIASITTGDNIFRYVLMPANKTTYETLPPGSYQDGYVSRLEDGTLKIGNIANIMLGSNGNIALACLSLIASVIGRGTITIDENKIKLNLTNVSKPNTTIEYNTDNGNLEIRHRVFSVSINDQSIEIRLKAPLKIINERGDIILDVLLPGTYIKMGEKATALVRNTINTPTCPATGVAFPPIVQGKLLTE